MQTRRGQKRTEAEQDELFSTSGDLFSPLPVVERDVPSTPSWSAPGDSVLNFFESSGHGSQPATPMTPTHSNRDTLLSDRWDLMLSDLSHVPTSGGRLTTLLTTPTSTTATSQSSLQTPRSAKHHHPSDGSLLPQSWHSKRKSKQQRAAVLMSQALPLQVCR
jgi:hypothetical protein